ncbi:MAG: SIS domain-containing protein [Patescibacteria group bacterium]
MITLKQTLEQLHEQISWAWKETQHLHLPASYKKCDRLVVIGMGGSALGAHVVKCVYAKKLSIPMEIVNGYELPGGVGKNTLVLLSSYSGSTEEVLVAYETAKKSHAKLLVMCAGGELAKRAKRDQTPGYVYDAGNLIPSNKRGVVQPRYASGFSVIGTLGMLTKLGFLRVSQKEVFELVSMLKQRVDLKTPTTLAKKFHGRIPVLVASEHLEGSAHLFANYCHETSKQFAIWFVLPELNHHLMEGLSFPKEIVKKMTFVLFESQLYHSRSQNRYGITAQVIAENGARVERILLKQKTRLLQAFELIQLAGYTTAELARLNKADPFNIIWVEWFKERMK